MTTRARRVRQNGSAIVEFALVGIPTMFLLLCIFEISRGMWTYETLAHAVREGARYAAVHGENCTIPPQCTCSGLPGCCTPSNSCVVTVAMIAAVIRDAGVGLDPNLLTVTLNTARSRSTTLFSGGKGPSTLTTLLADTSVFPAAPGNEPDNDLVVNGVYQFNSGLAMFWPGAAKVAFSAVNFGATSREKVEY